MTKIVACIAISTMNSKKYFQQRLFEKNIFKKSVNNVR